jgi:DNA polymerase-1
MSGTKAPVRLYLVDGSGYIFRAYHALPPLTRKSDGLPVGAVSGFCNMLYKLLCDMADEHDPTHFAVVFDHSARTFRNDLYAEYKANRPDPPEDLVPQFALVREATKAFNVCSIESEGVEADDIIATYARKVEREGGEVVIISSDKDLMQLVSDHVSLFDTMKNRRIGRAEVIEKFGVPPEKVVDVQALMGDSVDNVPGVPGIGVKTAAQLVQEFGDLETLLTRAGEIKQQKRRESLLENERSARLSKTLVTLKDDVALEFPLEALAMPKIDVKKLSPFLETMGFAALHRRVMGDHGANGARVAKDERSSAPPAPADPAGYRALFSLDEVAAFAARAYDRGALSVAVETDVPDPMRARIVGVALCVAAGEGVYVPVGHGGDGLKLDGGDVARQLRLEEVLRALKPALEDSSLLKVGANSKFAALVLTRHGVQMAPCDDVVLISYALDCGRGGHGLEELAEKHLGRSLKKIDEVVGAGKARKAFSEVEIGSAANYAAERVDAALRLLQTLKPRLAAEGAATVYETLERPLAPVILAMEREGIKIDRDVLSRLSADFAQRMAREESECHALAGEAFNLGSPKQISDILFGKLGLPGGRKTAGGVWSTKADILEELAAEGHPLPRAILKWRSASKLKSTYTDALPHSINPETGRVHTCYALASTTTGRLSSVDPNLQNIPIRTEDGRKIRTAFVPEKGNVLVSADYSQIELRLLAHVADLRTMKDAFASGVDIHALTASEMFGVPVEGMPPDVRRRAKAINFGIIYGISAFGLANQLGIERGEAKEYITSYFEKFPGIKKYMDDTVQKARADGYVETIFGRRIHVGAINDKNPALRGYAERQAINAPLQGAAADVIRRAMIRMPAALQKARSPAKMLLQVHDELVFECLASAADETAAIAASVMAKAHLPSVEISTPLVVEARSGANWDEAH